MNNIYNPCSKCRKKGNCPKVCDLKRDYERAINKRKGAKYGKLQH
jgi:hypothetical protein